MRSQSTGPAESANSDDTIFGCTHVDPATKRRQVAFGQITVRGGADALRVLNQSTPALRDVFLAHNFHGRIPRGITALQLEPDSERRITQPQHVVTLVVALGA